MEIILKEDIIGLGYKNEIVNVKSGYGRNYLIPTGKAVIASPSAKKQLAEDLRQQAAKIAAKKADAEKRAAQLDGVELVIEAKVSATGVTYGSVNTAIVAEELAKKGIEIDRKIITMRDIKKVGTFEATIHFFKDVEVKLPVTVVAENQPEPKAEEVKETVEVSVEEIETVEEEAPAAE
ncbi:50S ribosomal protein L9 [Prevotella falsenii]|uniref:50S ribosomal protein L9 n=1 Tax=Prevotella falsenii TaxID=515414 RepID=UPI00046A55DD|nr:50S ribosomal protein L9 [Prevotella falsenii]